MGLFDRDVLFSLTNFTLVGMVIELDVLRNLLSMLGQQCSYAFDVRWSVPTTISGFAAAYVSKSGK
jgi:hypothetical protein